MRTTLTIDDDVLSLAKAAAEAGSMSVGAALSELARRGHRASSSGGRVKGFAVFEVPDDAATFGPGQVRQAEADDDLDRYARDFR